MKQTAVQWLMHQMLEASMDRQTGEMYIKLPKDAFQQAKAMEREQIIDDFNEGFTEGCRYTTGFEQTLWQDEDDYYNKTYKQQ